MKSHRLKLLPHETAADKLPDLDALQDTQHDEAVGHLYSDKSDYPRFSRLESVHGLAGSMAPEEIVILGAQVAGGKSLFCQNLFDDLTTEQGIATLYIGTEQSAYILKTKHACVRCGVSAKLIIKPEKWEIGTQDYELALEKVHAELNFITGPEMRHLAFYANTRYVNPAELEKWITGGVQKYGIRCVIVDHIDQVNHGNGENTSAETGATVQLLHDLARDHAMPIVVASQLKRHEDPFRRHAPPQTTDFANSATKERVASVMFGLWRPLRNDLPTDEMRKMLADSKQGHTGEDRIYRPNTMGVRLLKDRLGPAPGKQVMLHVGRGGRLSDDLAETHGVRI